MVHAGAVTARETRSHSPVTVIAYHSRPHSLATVRLLRHSLLVYISLCRIIFADNIHLNICLTYYILVQWHKAGAIALVRHETEVGACGARRQMEGISRG